MGKIQKFTDLIAWREAHKLVLFVYRITKQFPPEEKFGLTNQSRRAVISITSNIAEGFGRSSAKDKSHFYFMAKTSLAELENQFIVARDLSYLESAMFTEFESLCTIVLKLIIGLVKSSQNYHV